MEAQPQELADIWSMLRRTASPMFRRSSHLFCIFATYKILMSKTTIRIVSLYFLVYTNSWTWRMEWLFYDRRSGEKCGEGKFFQAAPIRPSPADLFIVTVMVVVVVAIMVVTITLGPLSYVEHIEKEKGVPKILFCWIFNILWTIAAKWWINAPEKVSNL